MNEAQDLIYQVIQNAGLRNEAVASDLIDQIREKVVNEDVDHRDGSLIVHVRPTEWNEAIVNLAREKLHRMGFNKVLISGTALNRVGFHRATFTLRAE